MDENTHIQSLEDAIADALCRAKGITPKGKESDKFQVLQRILADIPTKPKTDKFRPHKDVFGYYDSNENADKEKKCVRWYPDRCEYPQCPECHKPFEKTLSDGGIFRCKYCGQQVEIILGIK